jgi:hypothetical protein
VQQRDRSVEALGRQKFDADAVDGVTTRTRDVPTKVIYPGLEADGVADDGGDLFLLVEVVDEEACLGWLAVGTEGRADGLCRVERWAGDDLEIARPCPAAGLGAHEGVDRNRRPRSSRQRPVFQP